MSDEPDDLRTLLAGLFDRHHASLREQLDRIENTQDRIERKLDAMSASTTNSLANLQAAVANETTIDQSVETLLTQLSAQIAAASPTGDNLAIDALVTQMQTNAAALSAAITTNTPAPNAGATGATGGATGATGPTA
jgi:septal ring factor EnvC (AmiA/AmiB activator)